jgi:hypothetical protein
MSDDVDRTFEHYKEFGRANGYTSAEAFRDADGQPSVYTLTLVKITERKLPKFDRKENEPEYEVKQILWFGPTRPGKDPPPPAIIGKEVWETISRTFAKFFGPKVRAWYGKRLTLTAEQTNKPRKGDWGIRPVGSPDIPEDYQATFKLGVGGGAKKTVKRWMRKTEAGNGPPTSRSPKGEAQ